MTITKDTRMHKMAGLTDDLEVFLHNFDHRASGIEEKMDNLACHRSQTVCRLNRVTDLFAIGIAILLCLLPLVIAFR